MMDTFVNMGIQMLAPLGHIKPVFPMPGGGTTQGHIEDVIHKFGKDVMIAAGGAIHGHPMGPAAGARAFRQGTGADGVDAVWFLAMIFIRTTIG